MIPTGFKFIWWGLVYELYAFAFHPYRRFEVECVACDHTARARSRNMALLKDSLHCALSDDHPTTGEDAEDWPESEAVRVEG